MQSKSDPVSRFRSTWRHYDLFLSWPWRGANWLPRYWGEGGFWHQSFIFFFVCQLYSLFFLLRTYIRFCVFVTWFLFSFSVGCSCLAFQIIQFVMSNCTLMFLNFLHLPPPPPGSSIGSQTLHPRRGAEARRVFSNTNRTAIIRFGVAYSFILLLHSTRVNLIALKWYLLNKRSRLVHVPTPPLSCPISRTCPPSLMSYFLKVIFLLLYLHESTPFQIIIIINHKT